MTRKIVLITGGSRGLGRSAALHLAARGFDLVITYRERADEAEQVLAAARERGARAVALPLDVARSDSFAAFAQRLAAVLQQHWQRTQFDALVNNAGTGLHQAFAETTPAAFDTLMNVHLKGPFFLTQALLPLLADGGRILNVSSGLTRFALPGHAAYAAMKGGVEVLTRYLAKELGGRGIVVNTLAPGAIETDFGGGAVRDVPAVNQMVASATALGRAGLPDDIGPVVAALLDPATGWVNAQRIEASGGMFV